MLVKQTRWKTASLVSRGKAADALEVKESNQKMTGKSSIPLPCFDLPRDVEGGGGNNCSLIFVFL